MNESLDINLVLNYFGTPIPLGFNATPVILAIEP